MSPGRIVPAVSEEVARIRDLLGRARQSVEHRLDREQALLHSLRTRSALRDPGDDIRRREEEIRALRDRSRRCMVQLLDRAQDNLGHQLARVRALSPKATLERGYAVLQKSDGVVVRDPDQVSVGEHLDARVAAGRFGVDVRDRGKPSGEGRRG